MEKILYLMVTGSIGTLLRYCISTFFSRYSPYNFPIGVFVVNMMGSFLFGLIWALSENKGIISSEMRLIILVGFMGSFTTFSTFAFDNTNFLSNGQIGYFILNIFINNVFGIFFVYFGFRISKLL